MKNLGAKWLALVAVVAAAAGLSLNGCGDGGGGTGAAGTTGAGGRGGTGTTGQAGRGGTGTAGTTATAGRGGTGTGGSTTGGTGGGSTAGTTGTDGGMGGALGCPGLVTFNTDLQSVGLNTFMGTAANSAINLAVREAGTRATIAWNGTEGDPSPGSARVDAPFDDYNQFVDIQRPYGATMLQDWRGYKLHVRLKVMGGNPSSMNPMGVQPYINTGTSYAYCAKYTNLAAGGGWNDYVTDLSMCGTGVDPSMVIAFGVSLQAGDGSNGDGGVNPAKPVAATIYVDSFWLEGSCGGAGGTGGGAGGTGGGAAGTGGGSAAGTGGGAAGTGGGSAAGTGGGAAGTGGGAAGTGGGAAGRGGTTGTAGTGGGAAGTGGGAAGTGGAATTTLFDFEAGAQSWTTSTPTTVAQSPDQHFDGTQSLKITYGALDNANIFASVNISSLWPGTVLTFHAYLPAGFDTSGAHYFQAIAQANNYKIFDSTGNGTRTATAGAWNTWTYTIPNTFPGGLNALGFQLGDNSGGATLPAGSVYLDAITATGGTQNCAVAIGTGAHTFEPVDGGLDPNVYKKDGSDADTVASQSTDRANGGTSSWKVAFTGLPAPAAAGTPTSRRVFIENPNIYCNQVATVHVFLPTGSDGMTFQVFAHYNGYAQFVGMGPTTVTRNAWNTYAYTVPANVGPGGIQRLGVQFLWSGTAAFTGNVYIDDVTW